MVNVGLAFPPVGKTELPITYRLETPNTLQLTFTTPCVLDAANSRSPHMVARTAECDSKVACFRGIGDLADVMVFEHVSEQAQILLE